jgi:hypothetical protein
VIEGVTDDSAKSYAWSLGINSRYIDPNRSGQENGLGPLFSSFGVCDSGPMPLRRSHFDEGVDSDALIEINLTEAFLNYWRSKMETGNFPYLRMS